MSRPVNRLVCRLRRVPRYNRGGRGSEGFLTPGVTWLLLAAADAGALHHAPGTQVCGGDWILGLRALPGALAMPDQPSELVYLGWLRVGQDEHAELTEQGHAALALVAAGDHSGYARCLRDAERHARTDRARRRAAP